MMNRIAVMTSAVAVLLSACAPRPVVNMNASDSRLPPYSPAEVRTHIEALAHDSMLGRLTAGPGIEKAANYIDRHFGRTEIQGFLGGPRVLRYEFKANTFAPNVVAAIPGTIRERADTLIVLVAHFDHIGTRDGSAGNDSIFNGADDNASGTAALLEAARLIKLRGGLPYTVVFAAVSGEESGMVGSRVLLESGRIDATRVVAAINMDMVGRGSTSSLTIIGGRRSFLGSLAMDVARRNTELRLSPVYDSPRSTMIRRSDHASFIVRGVPAIGLFTGEHPDYHQVTDSSDRVDTDKVARIAAYVVQIAERLAAR
jgi:hypothetical protein